MRRFLCFLGTAITVTLLFPPARLYEAALTPAYEQARLRTHFDRVLEHLQLRDVSALSASQRVARARQIDALRGYALEGVYPRNHDSLVPVPKFIDSHGTRCAMAHLIENSGGSALVARVAANANEATIHELAGDAELLAWLDAAGLTVAEAAEIQPGYGYSPRSTDHDSRVPSDDVLNSMLLLTGALGVPSVYLNAQRDRSWAVRKSYAGIGLMSSASLLTVGIQDWTHDGHLRWQSYLLLSVGTMAGVMSVWNLSTGPADATAVARTPASADLALRVGLQGEPQLGLRVAF